ncbi:MAG: OB-fold putative lipoprotein [Puniceicoccales bacterium]|nr:OB-fold putative lipoprotein [Puniceicoccales bacterium]
MFTEKGVAEPKHEIFTNSVVKVAEDFIKNKSYIDEDDEFIENIDGEDNGEYVHMRVWKDEKSLVIRYYFDDTWKEGFIVNFWTIDPKLIFASGLKIGAPLSELESFYGEEEDFSHVDDPDKPTQFYSYMEGSSVTFKLENGVIKSINYAVNFPLTSRMISYIAAVRDIDTPVEQPTSQPALAFDYQGSAEDLVSAFRNNAYAAEEKYVGKKIIINGLIDRIERSDDGNPIISIKIYEPIDFFGGVAGLYNRTDSGNRVVCLLNSSEKSKVAKLRRDRNVFIIGICKGIGKMNSLIMDNCAIVEKRD